MISVIMASYNGARYIREQLDSLLQQTVPPDEILVCDDHSTDETVRIIEEYEKDGTVRIRHTEHEENRGVLKSFEDAYALSTGEIIFFCDQDDRWKPEKIEITMKALQESGAVMAFTNAEMVDGELNPLGQTLWENIRFSIPEGKEYAILDGKEFSAELAYHNVVTGMTMAVRRELLDQCIPFSPVMLHDNQIALKACGAGKIAAIGTPLVLYRQHRGNVIGAQGKSLISKIRHSMRTLDETVEKEMKQTDMTAALYAGDPDRYDTETMETIREFIRCRSNYRKGKAKRRDLFRYYREGMYDRCYGAGKTFFIRDMLPRNRAGR